MATRRRTASKYDYRPTRSGNYSRGNGGGHKTLWIILAVVVVLMAAAGVFFGDRVMAFVQGLSATPAPTAAPATPTPAPTPEPTPEITLEPTPEVTPEITAEPTATPDPNKLTVSAVGDIMCHQSQLDEAYDSATQTYDFTSSFTDIAPYIQKSDLAIANLETTISGADQTYAGYPEFNSPESLLTALKGAGIDVLTTANEHIFDRKWYGVEKTLENIKAAGFYTTGTFLSADEYHTPLIVEANGFKVAILAYTDVEGLLADEIPDEKLDFCFKSAKLSTIKKDIAASREAGADIVVVCIHWGEEYDRSANSDQKELADGVITAGADIILGSHPHVLQTITYKTFTDDDGTEGPAAVAYSLGDLISGQSRNYKDSSVVLNFTFTRDATTGKITLSEVSYLPTYNYINEDADIKEFRVLPVGPYLDTPDLLATLSEKGQARLSQVWTETTTLLGQNGITALRQ